MDMTVPNSKSDTPRAARRAKNVWLLAPLLAIIGLFFAYQFVSSRKPAATPIRGEVISASTLEERYGMRINLLSVTAAGGMVDLRLKILDAEKAGLLLQDPAGSPRLKVESSGVILTVPEDSQTQNAQLKNGGIVFILFPNAGNAVKPGTPVTVMFGNTILEPIMAK